MCHKVGQGSDVRALRVRPMEGDQIKKKNQKRYALTSVYPRAGSVLAPLLWLIYINDVVDELPKEVRDNIEISLFADDIAILVQGITLQACETKMQRALDTIDKWAKENKVEISLSKTQVCYYTKDTHEVNKATYTNGNVRGHNPQTQQCPQVPWHVP